MILFDKFEIFLLVAPVTLPVKLDHLDAPVMTDVMVFLINVYIIAYCGIDTSTVK